MKRIGNLSSKLFKIFSVCSLVFVFVFAFIAKAEVAVQSTVEDNEVALGETVTLTVTVISNEKVNITSPKIPDLAYFDLVNSWSGSSTSSKLVSGPNGVTFETQRRIDYNYMLAPKQAGTFQIGAFEVVVDGKEYYTKPISMKVVSANAKKQPVPQRPNQNVYPPGMPNLDDIDEADEAFNQLLQQRSRNNQNQNQYRTMPKNVNEAFFIQVEVDKTEVYEGEPVTANFYIYTRGNIHQLDRLKFPDLKGFWKEDIEQAPNLTFTQEVLNGVAYRKALLASHALFPIKAGISYIDEYKIKATVSLPVNGFGAFGFGQAYTYTKSSEKVKITVKPIPTEGRPTDFTGAVGEFNIISKVDGKNFTTNQPFSFKIRFEGHGNAKLIELPKVTFPVSLELYDTKAEAKFLHNGTSYKEFDLLVIPRQEGLVEIPSISFSIFDPQKKVFVAKATQPVKIQVAPGSGQPVQSAIGPTTASTNPVVQPIAKEKALPGLEINWSQETWKWPVGHRVTWMILYALGLLILSLKLRIEMGWGQKNKDIKVELKVKLKKIHHLVDKGDYRKVGAEMMNVVYYVMGEVSGLGGAHMEFQKLLDQAPPSIRRELGEPVSKLLDVFQTLSFAPESSLGSLKDSKNLKTSVTQMENLLYKALSLGRDK